jgi:hypothetical protein
MSTTAYQFELIVGDEKRTYEVTDGKVPLMVEDHSYDVWFGGDRDVLVLVNKATGDLQSFAVKEVPS